MPIIVRNVPPEGWQTPEERLAFREWGERSDGLNSYRSASIFNQRNPGALGPEPCLVCGHPTGDCTDHEDAKRKAKEAEEMAVIDRSTSVQGTYDTNDDPNSNLYICPDDVVEDITPPGSRRVTERLVATKGETITRDRAIQLGLIAGEAPPVAGIPNAEIVTREGAPVDDVPQT